MDVPPRGVPHADDRGTINSVACGRRHPVRPPPPCHYEPNRKPQPPETLSPSTTITVTVSYTRSLTTMFTETGTASPSKNQLRPVQDAHCNPDSHAVGSALP